MNEDWTKKYKIIDVDINVLNREKFISILKDTIDSNSKRIIYTPYSEFFYRAHVDKHFREILNSSDVNIADGVFIQIASI